MLVNCAKHTNKQCASATKCATCLSVRMFFSAPYPDGTPHFPDLLPLLRTALLRKEKITDEVNWDFS